MVSHISSAENLKGMKQHNMQKEGKAKTRMILTFLFGIAGIALFGYILFASQSGLTRRNMQDEMRENSSYIRETFSTYEQSGKIVQAWADRLHHAFLRFILFVTRESPELAESDTFLADMVSLTGAQDLMVVDRDGNVLYSDVGYFENLKDDVYAPLFRTFETGQTEKMALFSWTLEDSRLKEEVWGNSVYEQNNLYPIFYSLAIDEKKAYVINDYGAMQMLFEDLTDAWSYLLKNEVIGAEGFAFAWSCRTGEILYYPDASFKGQDISVLGMDMDEIKDGQFVWEKINGETMYLYPVYYQEQDAWVVCAVPANELMQHRETTGLLLWLIFGILAADVVYYAAVLLKKHESGPKTVVIHSTKQITESGRKKKLLIFSVFCSSVVFLSYFYLQTLFLMGGWAKDNSVLLARIEKELNENQVLNEGFTELFEKGRKSLAKLACWYIEKKPENITTLEADTLVELLDLVDLQILDEDGYTKIASSSFLPGVSYAKIQEESKDSALEPADDHAQAAIVEDEQTTLDVSYISSETGSDTGAVLVPLREAESNIIGYVSAAYKSYDLDSFLERRSIGGTLRTVQPGKDAFAFVVDTDNWTFFWYPDETLIGKYVLDYGLKDGDLQDNLCQFIHLNKETFYAVTGQSGENLIYVAVEEEKLLKQRLPLALTGAVLSFLILLLIGLPLYTWPDRTDAEVIRAADRSRGETAEQKVFRNLLFGSAGLIAVIMLIWYRGDEDILAYVMKGNWEYGINVFALTASLIFLFKVGLALFLLRRMADIMTGMLSVRAGTGIRMLVSMVTYAGIILIAYRTLVFFGINPTTLMASAGIVSVVLGIGANSLVGDIIAGIFLLEEGNVQVGDMVRIGDFRGIVEELGVRMTKLYDVDSEDVKIIPNKEIQNVVHLSMHPANLFLEYQITYEEDLEKVEGYIKAELQGMSRSIPELLQDPEYLGVRRLDDNGVVLLVRAVCHEENRPRVTRGINRAIYTMFCRNGIEVPFPQLTLHL